MNRTMLITAVGIVLVFGSAHAADARPVQATAKVTVDPRVELISIIFRLAGNPEYSQGKVKSYTEDVESQFGKFRDHPVVQLTKKLRSTQGISFDAPMSLAVLLTDTDKMETRTPLNPWPESLDRRWTEESVRKFLHAARQFAKDTSFNEFFEQHKPLYETAESRMQKLLKEKGRLEWFGEFFGEKPDANFNVVLAMLNGGCCYGPHCESADGKEELYCILGVWKTDSEGKPVFSDEAIPIIVHEFCHSYANGIIDRHEKELTGAGDKIYTSVANAMQRQAYGNGMTALRESLVRACVIRQMYKYDGETAVKKECQQQKNLQFACVPELSELLAKYESNRQKYPTLESFSPQLIAFFNEFADKFAKQQKDLDAKRPKIVSITPANGDKNVNSGLKEIKVVFDRPMRDKCWSLVGGGPHFPETPGQCGYDAKCTTWTCPIKLKPGWDYKFMLNAAPQFMAFQSSEGVPLEPVVVTFSTAKTN